MLLFTVPSSTWRFWINCLVFLKYSKQKYEILEGLVTITHVIHTSSILQWCFYVSCKLNAYLLCLLEGSLGNSGVYEEIGDDGYDFRGCSGRLGFRACGEVKGSWRKGEGQTFLKEDLGKLNSSQLYWSIYLDLCADAQRII